MESRTDVHICRTFVVGIMDEERVREANSNDI